MGHLFRSLNLADAVAREGGRCVIATATRSKELGRLVADRGHRVVDVSSGPPRSPLTESDAANTANAAASNAADWVVVDHYGADDAYLDAFADIRLCVFDDGSDRRLDTADLVVDPSPTRASPPDHRARWLIGPSFAQLNSAFAGARPASLARTRPRPPLRLLITMGGADVLELTPSLVAAATGALPDAEICAVVGWFAQVDEWPASPRVRRVTGQTPRQMAARMLWADLAVATPSTTAFELACLGVPAILIPTAENQTRFVPAFAAHGAVVSGSADIRNGRLAAALASGEPPPEDRGRRWPSLCDGTGSDRVCSEMSRLCRAG